MTQKDPVELLRFVTELEGVEYRIMVQDLQDGDFPNLPGALVTLERGDGAGGFEPYVVDGARVERWVPPGNTDAARLGTVDATCRRWRWWVERREGLAAAEARRAARAAEREARQARQESEVDDWAFLRENLQGLRSNNWRVLFERRDPPEVDEEEENRGEAGGLSAGVG